jgi:hypothetical protein
MSAGRRFLGLAASLGLALALASCAQKAEPRRELTERERDSTLGKSVIPGAAAVTRSLEVSDSAAARASRMDGAVSGQ